MVTEESFNDPVVFPVKTINCVVVDVPMSYRQNATATLPVAFAALQTQEGTVEKTPAGTLTT